MPICEADPWRMQYFEGVACPDDVNVPTEDGDAWRWYPEYKWVYDKLAVAESQDLPCAPHGIDPETFPVFSKPIYNMRGMGAGSGVLRTPKEYKHRQRPGHMWMQLLDGEHVSTDVAVVEGDVKWQRHSVGKPLEGGDHISAQGRHLGGGHSIEHHPSQQLTQLIARGEQGLNAAAVVPGVGRAGSSRGSERSSQIRKGLPDRPVCGAGDSPGGRAEGPRPRACHAPCAPER